MRIIYGINPVIEALTSRPEDFQEIVMARGKGGQSAGKITAMARQCGVICRMADKEAVEKLAANPHHQGVVAVLKEFKYADIEDVMQRWRESGDKALILVLDCIQDPQNLGSLIRTAHAAGAHGVIIPRDRAAEVSPAVVKASAGAVEYTLIAQVTNIAGAIDMLKKNNIWVVGIEAGSRDDIYSFSMDMDIAVVVGSEGEGIRRLVKEKCDACLSIPMKGRVASLNASVAGGIALFEALRKRRPV